MVAGIYTPQGVAESGTVTIDWGDGSSTDYPGNGEVDFTTAVSRHPYLDDDQPLPHPYTMTITVKDPNKVVLAMGSATVTEVNVPPKINWWGAQTGVTGYQLGCDVRTTPLKTGNILTPATDVHGDDNSKLKYFFDWEPTTALGERSSTTATARSRTIRWKSPVPANGPIRV